MDGLWLFYPLYYVSQYVISGCMPGMHCVNPKKPDLQTPSCQGFPLGPAGLVEHLAMRSMASMMSACGNMAMPILGSSQLRDLRFLDLRANEPNAMGNSQFSHFQWVGKSFIGCFFYGLIFFLGRHPWIDANAKRYYTEVFDYLTLTAIAWILGAILGIQRASSCRVFDIVRPAGICRNLPDSGREFDFLCPWRPLTRCQKLKDTKKRAPNEIWGESHQRSFEATSKFIYTSVKNGLHIWNM